jgi:hypothetical protein
MNRPPVPGFGRLLIGQPDLAEGLVRALALKGAPPQFIESEFGLSVNALDLTDVEFLWTRRYMRLSQGIILPAVAAQFSQAVFAPVTIGQQKLAVVESLILTNSGGAGTTIIVDSQPLAAAPLAANVPKSALDDRAIPSLGAGQLQPTPSYGWNDRTAAGAISGLGAMVIGVPATSSVILPLQWLFTGKQVISTPAPSYLIVQCGTVNVAIHAAAVWRERGLLASEGT